MNDISFYAGVAAELRKDLHDIPEPSMHETNTKARLMRFLREQTALEVYDMGSWFYAASRYEDTAKSIAFRADFDAVTGEDGISRHLCGHDGHAAVLAAFAVWVDKNRPKCNIFFLFQPGEESGEGAKVCTGLFEREHIDEIYAFHNIPGTALGTALICHGTFACASEGLELSFTGRPAHAAYPEFGVNPSAAMAELILAVNEKLKEPHNGIVLSTVIGMDAGSDRYGVSASTGKLRLTIRAEHREEFEVLREYITKTMDTVCRKHGLQYGITENDVFPSTENDEKCVERLVHACEKAGIRMQEPEEPFRWSEDFGRYLMQVKGCIFGMGSGENCPALHTEHYCFPDEIIKYVLKIYIALCEEKGEHSEK